MSYIVGLHIPFWEVEFGGDVWGWVSSRESTVAYAAMDLGTKVYVEIQLYRQSCICMNTAFERAAAKCSIKFAPSWEVDFGGDVWVWGGWVGTSEFTLAGMDLGTEVHKKIKLSSW